MRPPVDADPSSHNGARRHSLLNKEDALPRDRNGATGSKWEQCERDLCVVALGDAFDGRMAHGERYRVDLTARAIENLVAF